MRVLLLSAYDTISHSQWRETLVNTLHDFEWEVLTLPPRYFNFRVRTSAVSWFTQAPAKLQESYDAILATSLSDLSMFKALFPHLSEVPIWMYCHENQFVYPASPQQKQSHIQDLKTCFFFNCLLANKISFNSHWNKRTALDGLKKMLSSWPERFSGSIEAIAAKSDVLAVPVKLDRELSRSIQRKDNAIDIVWNHRWEFDKGPKELLCFIKNLDGLLEKHARKQFRLHIIGQQFRQAPEEFLEIKKILGTKLSGHNNFDPGHVGFIENREKYYSVLQQCTVVLSTALHDFQGLSVIEAVAAGCRPLLPHHVVYPDIFTDDYLYDWGSSPEETAANAVALLDNWLSEGFPDVPDINRFDARALAENYGAALLTLS